MDEIDEAKYNESYFEKGPHFVIFVKNNDPLNRLLVNALDKLANHYRDKIKFSWIAYS